jgi:hypothetical protein
MPDVPFDICELMKDEDLFTFCPVVDELSP